MKDFYKEEILNSRCSVKSPSGKYELLIRTYGTKPGCWNYSRGTVYRISDGAEICDIKRDYSTFHHSWITKNNQEWLISGYSYLNQVAINLDTGEIFENGGKDPNAFCWAQCNISPDGNTLVVEGCYWAFPYEYKFFDFTDPSKPWIELEVEEIIDSTGGKEPVWLDDNTIQCFQCSEIYTKLGKTYDELSEEEISRLSSTDNDWSWRIDATLTLQRQGNKIVIIKEELTEKEKENRRKQKEASEKWNTWVQDFKNNNELFLTLKEYVKKFNIDWDKHFGCGGGLEDRRISILFREDPKWFYNIPVFKILNRKAVDLEWILNGSNICVTLWNKNRNKSSTIKFEQSKEGMISALRLVRKHTRRLRWF